MTFQSFAPGKDGGIDLLHGHSAPDGTVIQCKHFVGSGFAALLRSIERSERPKLDAMKPARYILATSVPLTPSNKSQLVTMLAPYSAGSDDIYGADDLNTLLRTNPKAEARHHKLWLTSTAVLQRVLRHGPLLWNSLERRAIERKVSLYVPTMAFDRALTHLEHYHGCVISGLPGIGKTTLAQMLALRLLEDGYELISVQGDIREAFDQLVPGTRQIIYYDDFLGQGSLGDRLNKNEDRGILRLLSEAYQDEWLRVIFTTREYILRDAQAVHEPLASTELDVSLFELALQDYSRRDKGRLLYNHLYFAGVADSYTQSFVCSRTYKTVVDHRNYSPRIIEWMTSAAGTGETTSEDYPAAFVKHLVNPRRVWEHAFEHQIGSDARSLLLVLASFPRDAGLDEVRLAWASYVLDSSTVVVDRALRDRFRSALRECEGSFTLCTSWQSDAIIEFHNPSIRDYLLNRLGEDSGVIGDIVATARYFEQLEVLMKLSRDGTVAVTTTTMVTVGAALFQAIERTIGAAAAVRRVYRRTGERDELTMRKADYGSRFATVVEWGVELRDNGVVECARVIADTWISDGRVEELATIGSARLVETALMERDASTRWSNVQRDIAKLVLAELSSQGTIDDWLKWSSIIDEHGEVLGDELREDWRQEVEYFLDGEVESEIDHAEYDGDLGYALDRMEELCRSMNIYAGDIRDRMEAAMERLRERPLPRPIPTEKTNAKRSQWERSFSDGELDQMFRALRKPGVSD